MLRPSARPSLTPSLRSSLGSAALSPVYRLFGAEQITPDTYVGSGARINPITGATVASGTALTVPGFAGSRALTWWGAMGAATTCALRSASYDTADWSKAGTTTATPGATGPSGNADAFAIVHGNAGADGPFSLSTLTTGFTAGVAVSLSLEIKPGSNQWLRLALRDAAATNGCDAWFNLFGGSLGSGASNGTGTYVRHSISPMANGWYILRLTAIISASATSLRLSIAGVSADSSATRVASTFTLRHFTAISGVVPAGVIPNATGSTASITADAISRSSAASPFPTGSPLLSQPWCMIYGVRLEGHSIGATGHVSGVLARHWDQNNGQAGLWYNTPADRQVRLTVTDNLGAHAPLSSTGVAADNAGVLVVYAMTFTPSVALRLYRNGVKIAEDLTVGATMTAWSAATFLGNRSALDRALTGWVTDPFLITGRDVPDAEIAAMSDPALWRMAA